MNIIIPNDENPFRFQSDEIAIHPELKLKYIPIDVFIKKVFDQIEKEILYRHINERLKRTASELLERWILESKAQELFIINDVEGSRLKGYSLQAMKPLFSASSMSIYYTFRNLRTMVDINTSQPV